MATKLIDFWPNPENCRDCLFTEAEVADEAVFLAAHQPMKVVRQYFVGSSRTEEAKSEEDVLEALLAPEPPSGTLVLPIIGASGVGKSHMIRWLDAHLKLRRDRSRRHVVRIPKSSSLRGVLDLILRDLPKKYDPIRKQLDTARLPVGLQQATPILNAQLRIALENEGKAAVQRLKSGTGRKDDQSRRAHCAEQGLIALLRDPEISRHFDAHEGELGVIARIADRFLHGNRKHLDVSNFVFQDGDLDFVLVQNSASLSQVTRGYVAHLKKPENRVDAIRFLNEVIDSALNKMVEMGGASLSELFIDLRRELMGDDMELVLLVEDFAVLAGIQGPLLDAMIREGIYDGRRKLCVMRTAMAVTTGMLPETVKTRAQAAWNIESRPFANDEEAIGSFCDFVGGYLNAARIGLKRLRAAYDEKASLGRGMKDWIPSYYDSAADSLSDGDKRLLLAFGRCDRGEHPLFPLNRDAIKQLADLSVREGNSYRFDPRKMMHRIIRETVVTTRDLFADKGFPPSNFGGFKASFLEPYVSGRIQSSAGEQADRVSALVYYWGGAPRTPSIAASMPPEVYQAFGAPVVDWLAKPEAKPVVSRNAPTPEKKGAMALSVDGKWDLIIDEWRTKGTIGQRDSATLRNLLAEGIENLLDWDALLMKGVQLSGSDIWLPKAKVGNPVEKEKAMAIAADDAALENTKESNAFFAAIRAAIRYDAQKSWNYEEGERDSAAYANLIGRLATQAEGWLRQRGPYLKPALVEPAARALFIDARILNLPGASAATDAENLRALLAPTSAEPVAGTDQWSKLRMGAFAERDALLKLLLPQIAARQGGGQPQAIDCVELLRAIKAVRTNCTAKDLEVALINDAPNGLREPLRRLRGNLETAVSARRDEIAKWRRLMTESFGEEFSFPEVQELFRTTLTKARENNVFRFRAGTIEILRSRLSLVGALGETVAQADRATKENANFGVVVVAVAQLDESTANRAKDLVELYSQFLKETGSNMEGILKDAPPSPDEVAGKLLKNLEQLDEVWTNLEKGASA